MMASKPQVSDMLFLPRLKIGLRVVPERRPWSRQRRGVVLIINEAHRDHVLAVKASKTGEIG